MMYRNSGRVVDAIPYALICVVAFVVTMQLNNWEANALRNPKLTAEDRGRIRKTSMIAQIFIWVVVMVTLVVSLFKY